MKPPRYEADGILLIHSTLIKGATRDDPGMARLIATLIARGARMVAMMDATAIGAAAPMRDAAVRCGDSTQGGM